MFDVIFVWRSAQEKHHVAPLRLERERFLSHHQDQGYSRYQLVTMTNILLHIVRVIGLTFMRSVGEVEVLEAAARWATDTKHHLTIPPGPNTTKTFQNSALRWLRFHDSLVPLKVMVPACEDLILAFANGERARGVSEVTARSYSLRVR